MARAVGLKAWTIHTEAIYILDSPSSVLDRLTRLSDQYLSSKVLYPKRSVGLS